MESIYAVSYGWKWCVHDAQAPTFAATPALYDPEAPELLLALVVPSKVVFPKLFPDTSVDTARLEATPAATADPGEVVPQFQFANVTGAKVTTKFCETEVAAL